MLDPEARLKEVAERAVTRVVEQGCGEEGVTFSADVLLLAQGAGVIEHLLHQVHDAERVAEPGVAGPGVDILTHTELVDPAEALNLRAVEQLQEKGVFVEVDRDVVIKRVAEKLLPHLSNDSVACGRLVLTHLLSEVPSLPHFLSVCGSLLHFRSLLCRFLKRLPSVKKERQGRRELQVTRFALEQPTG